MIKHICDDYILHANVMSCHADCHPAGDLALGEINGITPAEYPQTKSSQPGKRSRPCYGWISDDDDDDEEELIELPPAPLSKALYRLVNDGIN